MHEKLTRVLTAAGGVVGGEPGDGGETGGRLSSLYSWSFCFIMSIYHLDKHKSKTQHIKQKF